MAAGDAADAARIDDEAEPGRSRGRARGWLLVALGILVFELTANPALGIAVACVKFGWDDLATAFWLRRFDPRRRRGRSCFWFYLAAGFWRICLTGGLVALVTVAMAVPLMKRRPVPPRWFLSQLLGGAMVFALGFGLSTVTSLIGVLVGGWTRSRVWVGPEASWARRHRVWPPLPLLTRAGSSTNRADRIVLFSLVWVAMTGLVLSMIPFLKPLKDPQRRTGALIMLGAAYLVTVALPVMLGGVFHRHVYARTPRECWPEEPTGWPPKRADTEERAENSGRWPEFG